MKIRTWGSSPRSESRNAWTRIKNVNGASRLINFWNFFGSIQMISCRCWWPWTKPGYITVTRRQSNNCQWSGGVGTHPAPKKIRVQKSTGKVLAWFFWDQVGFLLIDYLPNGQTVNAEYYWSLLLQLKDILKDKTPREGHQGGLVLARQCLGSPGTCNPEETCLLGLPMSWSPNLFSGSGPVRLPPVPWTEKTIEISPFFVRRGGHCCRGDLVGRTAFWFFFFEWLANVRTTG